MADTFTSILNMTLPEIGASDDTWGDKLNDNLDILDALFAASGTGTVIVRDSSGRAVTTGITLAKAAANARILEILSGSSKRWDIGADATAEAGSNAGSLFKINRYSDAAALLGAAITIDRATGAVTLETTPLVGANIVYHAGNITKSAVGLGNVDNTADTAKPVSTAQQTALDAKASLASPTFTGNPAAPTPAASDNDTSIATTEFVQAKKRQILHVQDVKSNNTDGGTSSADTWNIRTLNTVLTNEISGASLASNRITLPTGTYKISARCQVFNGEENKARIYNVTASAIILLGMSDFCYPSMGGSTEVRGQFSVVGSTLIELQHFIHNASGTTGLGFASNAGANEIFADVMIEKVA